MRALSAGPRRSTSWAAGGPNGAKLRGKHQGLGVPHPAPLGEVGRRPMETECSKGHSPTSTLSRQSPAERQAPVPSR
jgi:hypothetical protein